jgi:MarR family transcriptional regulator, organic hydroperoxide resistance regulator
MHIDNKNKKDCFKPGKYLPGLLLWKASTLWQRIMTNELEPIGLTPVQFYLLSGLEKLSVIEGTVTQVELARYTEMNAMMTSNVLRTLEKKGFIRRVEHPSDTRANCLEITDKGKEVRQQAIKISQAMNDKFFEQDSDDTKKFVEYMLKIMERNEKFD